MSTPRKATATTSKTDRKHDDAPAPPAQHRADDEQVDEGLRRWSAAQVQLRAIEGQLMVADLQPRVREELERRKAEQETEQAEARKMIVGG